VMPRAVVDTYGVGFMEAIRQSVLPSQSPRLSGSRYTFNTGGVVPGAFDRSPRAQPILLPVMTPEQAERTVAAGRSEVERIVAEAMARANVQTSAV
jgi:hypothetical protein